MTISSRYFELGIALRLPPAELDSVRADESKSARALSGVLQAWLKQNYNTEKHGPPTWQKLVEAVDSPAGGNNHALAKAIAAEHPMGNSILFPILLSLVYVHSLYSMYVCTYLQSKEWRVHVILCQRIQVMTLLY